MLKWDDEIRERLSQLRLEPTREAGVVEELAQHLEDRYRELLDGGASEEAAQLAALAELDESDLLADEMRQVAGFRHPEPLVLGVTNGGNILAGLWQDVRYAVRMMGRSKAFTAGVVLTLAIGIGANTAIFSVVNEVLLRPLPYREPDQLVMLWSKNQQRGVERAEVSLDDYLDWQNRTQGFEEMAAFGPWGFNISGESEPEKITSVVVTPNLFKTLGVEATKGRTFLQEETPPGRNRVVLVSYSLWQRRYGANPDIVGRALMLDGKSYTVVGVMPAGFRFPNGEVEIWAPLDLTRDDSSRSQRWLNVVARLKADATLQQAQTEVSSVAGQLAEQYPNTNKEWKADVVSLRELVVKDVRKAVLLLFAGVGLFLLIAWANVANLQLARIEIRQKELAVRAALGAGRSRLLRMLLTENILFSLIGGTLGLLLGVWSVSAMSSLIPAGQVPGPDDLSLLRFNRIRLDVWVFGFAFMLALVTGIVFAVASAFQASLQSLNDALKEGGRVSGSSAASRLRKSLVIIEVAFTLVLLVGTSLLVRSFAHLLNEDPGFNSDQVLTFRLSPSARYRSPNERLAFYQQVVERLTNLPGVQKVGGTTTLPFSSTDLNSPFSIEGRPEEPTGVRPTARFHSITQDYLSAMGIKVVEGRPFTDRDDAHTPGVVLINETFARRYWSNENAIGKNLKMSMVGDKPLEVIGVVADTRQMGLDLPVKPEAYVPFTQRPWFFMTFAVRTRDDPVNLANAIKAQVWAVDSNVPVYSVATMDQRLSDSIAKRRFNMLLVGSFAVLALALAMVGIYGVVSYTVSQRTREIGIRIAFGAQGRDVLRLIVGQGLGLILVGVGIGVAVALALTRLMSGLLYGVTATDPMTFGGVSTFLVVVALVACYLPARRATRVDPIVALRCE